MDTITADGLHQPKHIKNLFGIKSDGASGASSDSNIGRTVVVVGAAVPATTTKTTTKTPSRRLTPRKSVIMRVADVETMLRYQLFLLSSYMEFMDDMRIDDDVDVEGKKAGSEAAAAAAQEAVVYGDARILRRLPKHVRNLSRHVNRLLANCDREQREIGSAKKPWLSDRVREELSCLDKMLGIESD